jgi:hypothetical protein
MVDVPVFQLRHWQVAADLLDSAEGSAAQISIRQRPKVNLSCLSRKHGDVYQTILVDSLGLHEHNLGNMICQYVVDAHITGHEIRWQS